MHIKTKIPTNEEVSCLSCSDVVFIMLINVKMPTIVGILTFMSRIKGLGSRRGEFGPAIEMHTDLKYVYMVYFIEKNRNFICLVLKL